MPRLDLRCRGDAELETKLLEDASVRLRVTEAEKKTDPTARGNLLATSVRLAKGMSARVDGIVADCRALLGLATEVETYVYPEPTFNAACLKPQHGRVMVLLSSSLLEAFDEPELRFVVGHELGHHLFDHHRIPLNALLKDADPPMGPRAMTLFAWSRYAEISADRAGLVCAKSLDGATRAFFKLASGLRGGEIEMRAEALLAQAGDMKDELARATVKDGPRPDWFATHPFSPLRLRAAKSFVGSKLFAGGASPDAALEAEVGEWMQLMEPSYLQEQSDIAELMRRLLMAGALLIASANGEVAPEEQTVLETYFGKGGTAAVGLEAMRRDLARRIQDVKARVPALRREQLVRDLCVVAKADGRVDTSERAVLDEIALGIEVDASLVERTLSAHVRLD